MYSPHIYNNVYNNVYLISREIRFTFSNLSRHTHTRTKSLLFAIRRRFVSRGRVHTMLIVCTVVACSPYTHAHVYTPTQIHERSRTHSSATAGRGERPRPSPIASPAYNMHRARPLRRGGRTGKRTAQTSRGRRGRCIFE